VARSRLSVWVLAARPKTLAAAVAPVIVGTAMAAAADGMHVAAAGVAMIGAILIQIGTNFCNDYCDYLKGADTEDRVGPTRAVQAGLVTPDAMRAATCLVFGLAVIACVYLVYRAGWPMVIIGALSIFCGIAYTAGPKPLAYVGLGDLFVLVFFGPVAVGGTYYVQALSLPPEVIVAGFAPGLISVGLLTVNNLRDVDQDRAAGKRTLVVRLGPAFARTQYGVAITLACLLPLGLYLWTGRGPVAVATVALLGVAIPAIRTVRKENAGSALNGALVQTARLLIFYCVVFSVGWLI
jgi:1,4-dihydroxy-2-naphthoate octaprenyltransferase